MPRALLPDRLARKRSSVNVVLFSRPNCAFCHVVRQHHLVPLKAASPGGVVVSEVDIEGSRTMVDASGRSIRHASFAARHGVRFAPTVMFLDWRDRELAPSIVGLSEDFFAAYLQERIAASLHAVGRARGS